MKHTMSYCAVILFVDTHYTEGHSYTLIVHSMPHSTVGVAAAPAYTTTFSLYGNHFTLPVLDFLCLLSCTISLAFMPRVHV
jgi:hypothetical protein